MADCICFPGLPLSNSYLLYHSSRYWRYTSSLTGLCQYECRDGSWKLEEESVSWPFLLLKATYSWLHDLFVSALSGSLPLSLFSLLCLLRNSWKDFQDKSGWSLPFQDSQVNQIYRVPLVSETATLRCQASRCGYLGCQLFILPHEWPFILCLRIKFRRPLYNLSLVVWICQVT